MTSKANGKTASKNYAESKHRRRRRGREKQLPANARLTGVPAGITEEDRAKIAHRLINFARLLTTKENFERHVAEFIEGAKSDPAIAKLMDDDERDPRHALDQRK